jgi:hypothetical protein
MLLLNDRIDVKCSTVFNPGIMVYIHKVTNLTSLVVFLALQPIVVVFLQPGSGL